MAAAAETSPANISLENWFWQHMRCSIGIANIDHAGKKTHVLSKVFFKDFDKKAELYFARDAIQYGFPDILKEENICIGRWVDWLNPSCPSSSELDKYGIYNEEDISTLLLEFCKKRLKSIEHVTIIFDSERTFYNSLLERTIVQACKTNFPNLRRYSLEFLSL